MNLHQLVSQVKEELKAEESYDMRTFDFHYFEHQNGESYDVVEFFIYEKPSTPNSSYVVMSYDLLTGKRLFKLTTNRTKPALEKKVIGFERQGQTYLFPDKESESKVFATLLSGKMTKLKDLPEDNNSNAYKAGRLLDEIDEVEQQVLSIAKTNFEDLRDFVYHNI